MVVSAEGLRVMPWGYSIAVVLISRAKVGRILTFDITPWMGYPMTPKHPTKEQEIT
jgi:hypothetical protein